MKNPILLKKFALLIIILTALPGLLSAGYYFRDDFTTFNMTTWSTNIMLGREGYYPYDNSDDFFPASTGNLLRYGDGGGIDDQTGNGSSGVWLGMTTILTGRTFTASPEEPFGFVTVISQWHFVIPNAPTPAAANGLFAIQIVEDLESNVTNYEAETGKNFNNFLQFFNRHYKGTSMTHWGAYVNGTDFNFDLAQALRADGVTISNINYMDELGDDSGTDFYDTVGIMITHNGSKVKMYMNPDPYNKYANKPNEFLLLDTYSVAFYSNLRVALNQQQKVNVGRCDAWYDYVLVRSAVDDYDANLPATTIASTNEEDRYRQQLTMAFQTVSIGSTNAGINVITVKKPSTWGSWTGTNSNNALTNEIIIETAYENKINLKTNVLRPWSQIHNLATNEAAIRINGDILQIRLGKAIDDTFTTRGIKVTFRLTTDPLAIDGDEYTFYTTVDSVLFDPPINNQNNFSTTGPQQRSDTIIISSLILAPSLAYARINPYSDYEGQNSYNFTYYISTEGITGRENIAWAAIVIPDQFTNANDVKFTNFTSVLMGTNVNNSIDIVTISLTNRKVIRLDYSANNIVAPGGLDVITFTVKVIGNVSVGTGYWQSWVDGSSLDNSSLHTTTNQNFPSTKYVIEPKGPAEAYASISPSSIFQGPDDYTFTYYISTAGIVGKQAIA